MKHNSFNKCLQWTDWFTDEKTKGKVTAIFTVETDLKNTKNSKTQEIITPFLLPLIPLSCCELSLDGTLKTSAVLALLRTKNQKVRIFAWYKIVCAQCIQLTLLTNHVHVFILDLLSLSRCIRVPCNMTVQKFTHLFKLWFLVSLIEY